MVNHETCETCERLIEKYGEENLNECPFCQHLYHGNSCNCGGAQEAQEMFKTREWRIA